MTKLCTAATLAMITRRPRARVRAPRTHLKVKCLNQGRVPLVHQVTLALSLMNYFYCKWFDKGRRSGRCCKWIMVTTNLRRVFSGRWYKVQEQQVSVFPLHSSRGTAPVWRHESACRQVIPILKRCCRSSWLNRDCVWLRSRKGVCSGDHRWQTFLWVFSLSLLKQLLNMCLKTKLNCTSCFFSRCLLGLYGSLVLGLFLQTLNFL